MASELALVLGGVRSGKSRYAEEILERTAGDLLYLATAEPADAEMAERITAHKSRRGDRWRTREEPMAIASVLHDASSHDAILVDCLTLWLTNLMVANRDIVAEVDNLLMALDESSAKVVLVSNEVGLGIIPDNAMARAFVDHAGALHQKAAAIADRVIFMAAGLPNVLKGRPTD